MCNGSTNIRYMMKRNIIAVVTALTIFWLPIGCRNLNTQRNHPSLKSVYRKDFLIGTALSHHQIQESDEATHRLITTQFNAVTAENVMKAGPIHPEWGRFNFEAADRFIDYGKRNGMYIVGHTLIWHSQLPAFVRTMTDADSLRQFMDLHIRTVGGRYADAVDCWDVVNEALNEDGSWRESVFYRLLGEEYLITAFRTAAEVDPGAKLYYNDYNIERPEKRAGVIRLIQRLRDAGVRIDGVGIQGHWLAGKVPFTDLEASIEAFSELGLEVAITELDLSVLPRSEEGADINVRVNRQETLNPYVNGMPDSVSHVLAADYERLFRLLLKHREKISRITWWGVNDGNSWLNNWPVFGRTDHPLLFDRANQPKPAYHRVLAVRTGR